MSTKSKIAIALFILQIISTAGIVIGTSKDYLGALASAIGLSIFMIIAAVLVLLDNKEKQDKINQLNKKYVENKTANKTAPTLTIIDDEASIDENTENTENTEATEINDQQSDHLVKENLSDEESKLTPHQETLLAIGIVLGIPAIIIFFIFIFNSL